MTHEDFITLMLRTQWREEGDLRAPHTLSGEDREIWFKEAKKIELEEMQSAVY